MHKTLLILTLAAGALLPVLSLRAQAPSPTAAPSMGQATAARSERLRDFRRSLPPQDRQKLRAAHEAAMADPAVQAAKASGDRRATREATREAMLRYDPSVASVLDKRRAALGRGTGSGRLPAGSDRSPGPRGNRGGGEQLAYLPADERRRLVSASHTAQNDPQVAALRQKWVGAATPEAKAQAGRDYRQALRDAVLRNDPSLAPVIQKVQAHREAEVDDLAF